MTAAEFFQTHPQKHYAKGEVLVQAGQDLPGVFYIVDGRISQYDISPGGNHVVVNVFKPGAFFPMSWALNKTPNAYFFEAATDVTVHLAPADKAVAFLRDNPEVTLDLLSRVYRGMDGVLRRMAHLMGGDAKTRLVFELLNAAYRFGETQPDGSVRVALTESDLAAHTGMARETVSRTIVGLKESGHIIVERQGYIVRDLTQLEATLGNGL